MVSGAVPEDEWQPVCRMVELEVDRGVTALVHGQAIAIFRTGDDVVYALGNHDPFGRAAAGGIAKGIVGRRGGVPFVGSPAHRHAFDLRSGRCLDDRHVAVPCYAVKVIEGVVLVGSRKVDAAQPAAALFSAPSTSRPSSSLTRSLRSKGR